MNAPRHLPASELEAGLAKILQSPTEVGVLHMIVRRPAVEKREVLEQGELHPDFGLVGDCWNTRSGDTPDPDTQITIMNARAVDLVAQSQEHWPLAGDQLFIDMDLRPENLPTGTRLAVGAAVLEVTAVPHNGCKKFSDRFGIEALKFVNSAHGKGLRLRGIYAKVVQAGEIKSGDEVRRQ